MYYVEFGKLLCELRKEKGLSQSALASLIGSSKAVISKYENAMSYPPYDVLIKIARVFKVSTDYLLGVEKTKTLAIDDLTSQQINTLIAVAEEYRKLKNNSK